MCNVIRMRIDSPVRNVRLCWSNMLLTTARIDLFGTFCNVFGNTSYTEFTHTDMGKFQRGGENLSKHNKIQQHFSYFR